MAHSVLRFPFNERAATEAAVVLVRAYGKPMRLWRLLKVLHLAERESLKRHGMPIFGGTYCSMERGPVPSEIYNLTKGERPGKVWTAHLQTRRVAKDHIEVSVEKDLEPAELTRGNLDALAVVRREYLRMSTDALDRAWERYHGNVEALVKEGVTEENRSKVVAAIRKHAQVIENLREKVA